MQISGQPPLKVPIFCTFCQKISGQPPLKVSIFGISTLIKACLAVSFSHFWPPKDSRRIELHQVSVVVRRPWLVNSASLVGTLPISLSNSLLQVTTNLLNTSRCPSWRVWSSLLVMIAFVTEEPLVCRLIFVWRKYEKWLFEFNFWRFLCEYTTDTKSSFLALHSSKY